MHIQSIYKSTHNFVTKIKSTCNDAYRCLVSQNKTHGLFECTSNKTALLPKDNIGGGFTSFFQKNMLALCGIGALALPCMAACFYAPLLGSAGIALLSLAVVLLVYYHTPENAAPRKLEHYAIHNAESMNKLKTMNVALRKVTIKQPLSPEDWQVIENKLIKEKGACLVLQHEIIDQSPNAIFVPQYLRDYVASYTMGKRDDFRGIRKIFPYLQECRFYNDKEMVQHIANQGTETNAQKQSLSWTMLMVQDNTDLDDRSLEFYQKRFKAKGLRVTIQ